MKKEGNQPATNTQDQPSTEKKQFISFFQAAHRIFQKAGQSAGDAIDRFYQVDGHTIRLSFAGSAIMPYVTPALEHLSTQPSCSPSLTICVWDNISTSTILPPLPGALNDYVTRRGIRRYDDGRFFAALFPGIDILNVIDTKRNLALYCLRDLSQFPQYQLSSPLLTLLHWGMRKYGLHLIHAAAVGTPSLGAVLIVGKGGAGKSTIALTCLNSTLAYVADDYCLLGLHPAPYAYNLYNTGKLERKHIQRFPHLAQIINGTARVEDGKRIFFLHSSFPEKIAKSIPIRAILVPLITGRPETKLTNTSASTALKALAPNTIYQLPGIDRAALDSMIKLVKQVPCYGMELGTNLDAIPDIIMNLLSHIS